MELQHIAIDKTLKIRRAGSVEYSIREEQTPDISVVNTTLTEISELLKCCYDPGSTPYLYRPRGF